MRSGVTTKCRHCRWDIEEADWRSIEGAGSRCLASATGHEREKEDNTLDAVTVILLLLVGVLGSLTIAAQVGMWIGRSI